uniref:Plastid ribosomal protein L21 n=1 Tax=Chlamydomonas euryale TaxID=1486919 RepID=A0A7R9V6Y4_9CHLO
MPVRAPSPALFAPPVKMLANRASQMSRVRPFAAVRPTAAGPVRVVAQAAAANADAKAKKVHPSPLNVAAPSTYAIIEVSGTQMFVEPGKWYTVNRLKADVGAKIKFGRVLALKNEDKLTVGMPYLDTVNVEAEIVEELRGPKVIVYKMRPKKHYRRKQGHRQELTKFKVTSISP